MFKKTGEYSQHKLNNPAQKQYYTFTPCPLFNNNFITLDPELIVLLTSAHKTLGILEGMSIYLPDSEIIKELMLLKESCSSLQIDGKGLPFEQAINGAAPITEERGLVGNTVLAMKSALGKTVRPDVLSEVYSILTNTMFEQQGNSFREKQLFLYKVITNLKIYSPTAPEEILPAVQDIDRYLSSDDLTDILIKVALVHYQFEMIHPFEKYNGIVGRIVVQMILSSQYKAVPFLCLSEYLLKNKAEYFRLLTNTQISGDYLSWVKFIIRGIIAAADQATSQITRYVEIAKQDENIIASSGLSTKSLQQVYNYFKKQLITGTMPASKELGLSFNAVSKAINILVELGILQLVNQQARHRVFGYTNATYSLTEEL